MSHSKKKLIEKLSKDSYHLLVGYESYQYSMKDLVAITGHSRQDVYYIIYRYFPTYIEGREITRKQMLKDIEHYINMGIPIDIIAEKVAVLQDVSDINTLRRTIARMMKKREVNPEVPPITLGKFSMLYKRVWLKTALLENESSETPLSHKKLAEKLNVSFSLLSKINQYIDDTPPYVMSDKYASIYLKIEQLSKIKQDMENHISKKQLMFYYELDETDLLMIEKTFRLINHGK